MRIFWLFHISVDNCLEKVLLPHLTYPMKDFVSTNFEVESRSLTHVEREKNFFREIS